MNVQYPNMRRELVDHLKELAAPSDHSGSEFDFDLAVHFLFDDTSLSDAPERTVGVFLATQQEVGAVTQVAVALEAMFDALGTELPYSSYRGLPAWTTVQAAAQVSLDVIQANESIPPD